MLAHIHQLRKGLDQTSLPVIETAPRAEESKELIS